MLLATSHNAFNAANSSCTRQQSRVTEDDVKRSGQTLHFEPVWSKQQRKQKHNIGTKLYGRCGALS